MVDLSKLKIETYDVKNKIVVINECDLENEAIMEAIGKAMRKAGAIDIIFTNGVEIELLSDEDLDHIGLMRKVKSARRSKKKEGPEALN